MVYISFFFKKLIIECYIELDKINMVEINNDELIANNERVLELLKKENIPNEINIVAKGETAIYSDKIEIGINQGIIFTKNKKYIFLNDFENLFGVEHIIKDIKYVFCPDYPHVQCKSKPDFTYLNLKYYLDKHDFNGEMFVYQIHTTKNKRNPKYFFNSTTTSDIPIQFFKKFFDIKKINFYGCGKSIKYHKDIYALDYLQINKTNDYLDLKKKYKNRTEQLKYSPTSFSNKIKNINKNVIITFN